MNVDERYQSGKKIEIGQLKTLFNNPVVKIFYFLVLFAVVTYYLLRWRNEIYKLVSTAKGEIMGAIFLLCCGVILIYAFIQYRVYQEIGVQISFPRVLRIMTLAQLGKYFPGKIFFAGNYFLFSREMGVRPRDIGASFMISQYLWFLSACASSVAVISFLSPILRYSILFLPIVMILFIHPKVLNPMFSLAEKIARKYLKSGREIDFRISKSVGYIFYAKIILLYLLGWIIVGFQVYLAVYAFYPIEIKDFSICLSSAAVATVIGFLVIFAPQGLGVREGVGTLILATVIPVEVAFLAMIAWRILGMVVDLSFALFSVVGIRATRE